MAAARRELSEEAAGCGRTVLGTGRRVRRPRPGPPWPGRVRGLPGDRASVAGPAAGTDAAGACWTPVEQVLSSRVELAFDHQRIVVDGVERARAKLEHSALATAFCGETFTLSELQQVYEAVWGVRLDPRNFYRKIQGTRGFVVAEGPTRKPETGRPARLYRAVRARCCTCRWSSPPVWPTRRKQIDERRSHRDPHGVEPGVRGGAGEADRHPGEATSSRYPVRSGASGESRQPGGPGSRRQGKSARGGAGRTGDGGIQSRGRAVRGCRRGAMAACRPRRCGDSDPCLRVPRRHQPGRRAQRPRVWEIPHGPDQIARHLDRTGGWMRQLPSGSAPPKIHFGPIAAGETVQDSAISDQAQWIREHYNDALAIEMEAAGDGRRRAI